MCAFIAYEIWRADVVDPGPNGNRVGFSCGLKKTILFVTSGGWIRALL